MAEPTIDFQIQAYSLLTLFCMFWFLFQQIWTFHRYLELHAIRRSHRIRHRHSRRLPAIRSKQSGKKKQFREKMKRKTRKIPRLTYLLVAAFRVGCCIERALRIAYLRARQAACSFHSVLLNVREKTGEKVRDKYSRIIAFQANTGEDLPTHLTRFDTDSFCIGVDTLCTRTLSGNKDHFEDLKPYKGSKVTRISGGLEIEGEGTFVFRIQSDDGITDAI